MQSESHALSTNLPMLHLDIEIRKRLLGMPIRMAALTLEKNWITKGVRCTMPAVETCSIMILPPGLNDSTLSSSCLKAVLPLSMLHTA